MIKPEMAPTLFTVLIVACNGQVMTMKSNPRSVEDLRAAVAASFQVSPPRVSGGGANGSARGDYSPPSREDQQRAIQTRMPALGLSDGASLDGAVVRIVRDARSDYPRLIILNRSRLDEHAFLIARSILLRDVAQFPQPQTTRVITLWGDLKQSIEANGKVQWKRSQAIVVRPSDPERMSARMRAYIAKERDGAVIDVAGTGPVRIVVDPRTITVSDFAAP